MHRIGKIHWRRATRQFQNPALGSKDVDLVREQVLLHALDELHGITGVLLHLQQPLHPLACPVVGAHRRFGTAVDLVVAVFGNTLTGHRIHVLRTDLDFNGHALGAEEHRMQGLIAVGLGDGDVILETARHRLVEVVHGTEDAVTVVDAFGDHAEGEHIHDVGKRLALYLHLAIDAVEMLFTPADPTTETFLVQPVLHAFADMFDDVLALTTGMDHGTADTLGPHGVIGLEGQIFQFDLQITHAQTGRDGRVDVEGFTRDAALLVGTHRAQGTHVVQTIGELDQDDADILGHRQHHLLKIFRLGLGLGFKLQMGQFGDAIDNIGHRSAKLPFDAGVVDFGIFDHVMQHGRHQALMVHVHAGQNIGNRQWVSHIGLATLASLAIVGLLSVEIGTPNPSDLLRDQILFEAMGKGVYRRHQHLRLGLKAGQRQPPLSLMMPHYGRGGKISPGPERPALRG